MDIMIKMRIFYKLIILISIFSILLFIYPYIYVSIMLFLEKLFNRPFLPPNWSPILYISDAEMTIIKGIIKYEDDEPPINVKDLKITVVTSGGIERQIKSIQKTSSRVFTFAYAFPLRRSRNPQMPFHINKKIKQKIVIIKIPEREFKRWSLPHIVKCEVMNNKYQVIPSIRKITSSRIIVTFIVKKR